MKVPVRKLQIAGGASFTDTLIWTDIEGMPDAPTIPSEFADALDV